LDTSSGYGPDPKLNEPGENGRPVVLLFIQTVVESFYMYIISVLCHITFSGSFQHSCLVPAWRLAREMPLPAMPKRAFPRHLSQLSFRVVCEDAAALDPQKARQL